MRFIARRSCPVSSCPSPNYWPPPIIGSNRNGKSERETASDVRGDAIEQGGQYESQTRRHGVRRGAAGERRVVEEQRRALEAEASGEVFDEALADHRGSQGAAAL